MFKIDRGVSLILDLDHKRIFEEEKYIFLRYFSLVKVRRALQVEHPVRLGNKYFFKIEISDRVYLWLVINLRESTE